MAPRVPAVTQVRLEERKTGYRRASFCFWNLQPAPGHRSMATNRTHRHALGKGDGESNLPATLTFSQTRIPTAKEKGSEVWKAIDAVTPARLKPATVAEDSWRRKGNDGVMEVH